MHLVCRAAIAASFIFFCAPPLFAHKEYVHQYLAVEAYKLLKQKYPGFTSSPFDAHIGAVEGGCETFSWGRSTITSGAYVEDCTDPVYHYGDVVPFLDKAYFSASHFWDADLADHSKIEICDILCHRFENAYQKSLRYIMPGTYGRWTAKLEWPQGIAHFNIPGGGTESIFHFGMIGFEYDDLVQFYLDGICEITGYNDITGKWLTAGSVPDQLPITVIVPQSVRDRIVWEVLGRIAHLLGDMGVPAHVHYDIHPPFWWNNDPPDVYEEEMALRYSAYTWVDAKAQGGIPDLYELVPGRRPERIMRYLFYTVNQLADRFPSNDAPGDANYDRSYQGDDYAVLRMIDGVTTPMAETMSFHQETADIVFVYSIRAIAGLFDWFTMETGIVDRITVETSYGSGTLLVDTKPTPSGTTVSYPGGTPFTLEALDGYAADPASGGVHPVYFQYWVERPRSGDTVVHAGARLNLVAEREATFTAVFDHEYRLTLGRAVDMDAEGAGSGGGGGSGAGPWGSYSVGGVASGESWSGTWRTSAGQVEIRYTPPAGCGFLQWSDGSAENPRMLSPAEDVTVSALFKKRMTSDVTPGGARTISRISAPSAPSPGLEQYFMTYESGGDIYFASSVDGISWSTEQLLSEYPAGEQVFSSRPSIGSFRHPSDGGVMTFVVWEERDIADGKTRIVGRAREEHPAGPWGLEETIYSTIGLLTESLSPTLAADIVVWRSDGGLRMKPFFDQPGVSIPGTAAATGQFSAASINGSEIAVVWTEPGGTIRHIRGARSGTGWTSVVAVNAAGSGELRTGPTIVASGSGKSYVGWSDAAAGVPSVQFATVSSGGVVAGRMTRKLCAGDEPLGTFLSTHESGFDASLTWLVPSGVYTMQYKTGVWTGAGRAGDAVAAISAPYDGGPAPAAIRPYLTVRAEGGLYRLSSVSLPAVPVLPQPAVLSSPGDYATGIGSSVTLVWQCAPDAVSFNLDVDDEPSFAAPRVASVVGIAGTSRAVPNLLPGRSYYWRVTGVSPNGTGTPSPSQRFTTAPVPPAPYLSGSAATVGTSQHPMLSWQPVSGAVFTLYRYRCDESAECGDASPRETVYNGTGTSWIDTRTKIGKKYSSSRAYYYLVATVLGFTSAPSNQVSYAVDGTIVYSAGRSGDEPGPGEGPRSADGPDGAGVRPAIPEVHRLGDNYPNPFNPSTRIPFDIAEGGGHVRICVYSSDGREVGVIADGAYSPGFHEVRWDGASLGAGVYFIQMTLIPTDGPGVFREMKKALLLK